MPLALVTGATAGLGAEFAAQLAATGHDLVLVARDAERLESVSTALAERHEVRAEVLAADLGSDDGCASVTDRIGAGDVDVLVNNAGVGSYRPFTEDTLERHEAQLDLNVRAILRLTHAAARTMSARGSGRILNVSSVAGFVPRAGNVTYSASKAWTTMFSEALAVELAGTGVTVTAVCPGFTHTEFHDRAQADMSHVPDRMWLDARDVVREGLADAFAGKPVSVPSLQYKVLVHAARTVPRPVLRRIMGARKY